MKAEREESEGLEELAVGLGELAEADLACSSGVLAPQTVLGLQAVFAEPWEGALDLWVLQHTIPPRLLRR